MSSDTHDADAEATWRLWLTAKKVTIHERGGTVEGEDDVDLEVYVFDANKLAMKTEATTQKGMGRRDGKEGLTETSQTALVATLKGRGAVSALLYPRLKTEPAPKVTWFANGAGVQIETASGMDYLFVSDTKAEGTSPDRQATFFGQAAAIQVRAKAISLSLGSAGRVQHRDKILEIPMVLVFRVQLLIARPR